MNTDRRRLGLIPRAALAVACLALGSIAPTEADVVYSNFGPGSGIDTSVRYAIFTNPVNGGRQDVAVQFTVGPTSFSFTSAEVALTRVGSVNLVDVVLFSNTSANAPGTALQTIAFTTSGYSVETVNAIAPLTLDSNTCYWLAAVAVEGGNMLWARTSDVNDIGLVGVRDQSLIWRSQIAHQREAFRINGEPIIVPEPSTLALLNIGTLGLLGHAWRWQKRTSKWAVSNTDSCQSQTVQQTAAGRRRCNRRAAWPPSEIGL